MNENTDELKSIFVACLLSAFALTLLFSFVTSQPIAHLPLEPTAHGTMVPAGASAPVGSVTLNSDRANPNPLYEQHETATHSPAKGTLSPVSATTSPRINQGDPMVGYPLHNEDSPTLSEPDSWIFNSDEPAPVYNYADYATAGYQRGMAECIAASQDMNHPHYGQECS